MSETTRRRFLQYGLGGGALLALPATARRGLAGSLTRRPASGLTGGRLTGGRLRKFREPLPVPGNGIVVATPSGTNQYSFTQREIKRRLHPDLPPTTVWAYDDGSGLGGQAGSFGMVLAAESGTPLRVSYTNRLPDVYPDWIPVNTRLTSPNGRTVRPMTHLHGGFVAADSDGNPTTDGGLGYAPGQTQHVYYTNQLPQMPASLRWFHDHGMGTTRLNVFAGLAAGYLIRDSHDTGTEPNPIGIPGGAYEIPLVIQDRQFRADGKFLYPVSDIPGVTWIGEYFGDHMLVNGKVWPYLDVEPRMYRFRVLNGCNARIMSLGFGLPMWQIGAEGGLFDVPVRVSELVLASAERADVLVDFRGLEGRTLELRNHTPAAPVSTPAPALGAVMQVRVGTSVTHRGPRKVPDSLPGQRARLHHPVKTRYITLNEIGAETAGWTPEPERGGLRVEAGDGDPEGRHRGGLGLGEHDRRHAPHARAPGHVPGGRAHAVRRRGLPGQVRRACRACPAGSAPSRSPPARWSRPPPTSADSRTRSRPTPATSPRSGPGSTCPGGSPGRRATSTTATSSSTRTTR